MNNSPESAFKIPFSQLEIGPVIANGAEGQVRALTRDPIYGPSKWFCFLHAIRSAPVYLMEIQLRSRFARCHISARCPTMVILPHVCLSRNLCPSCTILPHSWPSRSWLIGYQLSACFSRFCPTISSHVFRRRHRSCAASTTQILCGSTA